MFTNLTIPAQKFISDNATTILTSVGVTGTVTTGILSAKAGFRSARKIDAEWEHDENVTEKPGTRAFTENVKLVWPEFIPAVGAGAVTIGAILFSHKMNATRATALAATYSAAKAKFESYRDEVAGQVGPDEEQAIHDRVEYVYMGGEVLFLDQMTGRYFTATMLDVKTAECTVNHEIMTHGFASLGMFYDEIGLVSTDVTEDLGWNSEMLVDVDLTSEITPDGRPAIVMSFVTVPKRDFR